MKSLVSICIPTYRQISLLKENLESICSQSYKNFEVLVSDDTPDKTVEEVIKQFTQLLPIQYIHNSPSLGSPANWNSVLKKAKGDYIILLHHDDRFANPDALQTFVKAMEQNPSVDFAFGRNRGVDRLVGEKPFPVTYYNQYYRRPELLVLANMIGVPSNVFIRKKALLLYDERYKWIVDIEYYTRLLKNKSKFIYLDQELIATGIHEGQVTNECINDSAILLYENISYAIDHITIINNVKIFDFYWRLLRNNNVRSLTDLYKTGLETDKLPRFIKQIVHFQTRFSLRLLKNGFISKPLMFSCFLQHRFL